MSSYTQNTEKPVFRSILDSFSNNPKGFFEEHVNDDFVKETFKEHGVDFASGINGIYTPIVTMCAFVCQVLSAGKSCMKGVMCVLTLRAAMSLPECSSRTSAYCKARAKLPEPVLKALFEKLGDSMRTDANCTHLRWHNHEVILVDGTHITLPDTPENQREYPQPKTQKPGVGFPKMRLVGLITLAVGAIIGLGTGCYEGKETGEGNLFRQLFDRMRPGDVVVADRNFCSYFTIAELQRRGVQVVFRLHSTRKCDFRRGKRLGSEDHIVTWFKPAKPYWMDAKTYAEMPDEISIREARFQVNARGYRSKEITVITTLLDATSYPKEDMAKLYYRRWCIEIDFRSIKTTMKMETLSCKTPEMVRKELYVHIFACNKVRQIMALAANKKGCHPRNISFATALHFLESNNWLLPQKKDTEEDHEKRCESILINLGQHLVGNREGRVEPRKIKRRRKHYDLLQRPRGEEHAELLNG